MNHTSIFGSDRRERNAVATSASRHDNLCGARSVECALPTNCLSPKEAADCLLAVHALGSLGLTCSITGRWGRRKCWFLTCWPRSSVSHTTTGRRKHTEPPQHARSAPPPGVPGETAGQTLRLATPARRAQAPPSWVPFKEKAQPEMWRTLWR